VADCSIVKYWLLLPSAPAYGGTIFASSQILGLDKMSWIWEEISYGTFKEHEPIQFIIHTHMEMSQGNSL
jgi:hypothetical protein